MNLGIMKLSKGHPVTSSPDKAEGHCGPRGKRFICRWRGLFPGLCCGHGSSSRRVIRSVSITANLSDTPHGHAHTISQGMTSRTALRLRSEKSLTGKIKHFPGSPSLWDPRQTEPAREKELSADDRLASFEIRPPFKACATSSYWKSLFTAC